MSHFVYAYLFRFASFLLLYFFFLFSFFFIILRDAPKAIPRDDIIALIVAVRHSNNDFDSWNPDSLLTLALSLV